MAALSNTNLPVLPEWEQLSERVTTILGLNPGPFTLQGTNTYLVGTGKVRLLIDTGEGGHPQYLTNLSTAMKHTGCDHIDRILITHYHFDHTGGIEEVMKHVGGDCTVHKYDPSNRGHVSSSVQYHAITDGQTFTTEGATLIAMYTPGHSNDHICLFLKEENCVFTGDCILGHGTTHFTELHPYMTSLRAIRAMNPTHLYPAHGAIIKDGCYRVDEYIKHRDEREQQIMKVVQSHQGITCMEIVKVIYVGVAPAVIPAAAMNVLLHLEKLETEGKVTHQANEAATESSTSSAAPSATTSTSFTPSTSTSSSSSSSSSSTTLSSTHASIVESALAAERMASGRAREKKMSWFWFATGSKPDIISSI